MDRVVVTYYTDPLCCWSWAFEKEWRMFIEKHTDILDWKYVMGGMIQDWKVFSDPMNAITKPFQMGPVWMHAAQISNTKINFDVWHKDPPASSYPACIAVKAAEQQSAHHADLMLQALRKAVMLDGLNIARKDVILSIADALSQQSDFDAPAFDAAFSGIKSRNDFRGDLQKTAYHKIGRFPTLTFVKNGKGIMMTGYRTLPVLESTLEEFMETYS